MIKELIKIANELDSRSLVKEADYLDIIIKNAFSTPFLWSSLMACAPDNQIIPITKDPAGGGLSTDSGSSDTGDPGQITWEELPDCTQKIEWIPAPSDSRWEEGGVPIEDFYIVGRDETIPAEAEGEHLFSIINYNLDVLVCEWSYVPDTCGYWTSEFNVWSAGDAGMEAVYDMYKESPLIRVQVQFPIEYRGGNKFLRLPDMGAGGSIIMHSLEDECVQEYLETIGEEMDTGV